MPALRLQHHRGRSRLGQMRQRRVTQLVESPPTRMAAELRRGCAVRQPGLARRRVQVTAGRGGAGPPPGEEQRPPGAGGGGNGPRGERWGQPTGPCRRCRPWNGFRARRRARSKSPTSRASTSEVRAAVSYSIRHSSFSRNRTPRRRHKLLKILIRDRPGVIRPPPTWTHPRQQIAGQRPPLPTPRSERLDRDPPACSTSP